MDAAIRASHGWMVAIGSVRLVVLVVTFFKLASFLETSNLFWGVGAAWNVWYMLLGIAFAIFAWWAVWITTGSAVPHLSGWLTETISREPFLMDAPGAIGRGLRPTYLGTLARALHGWFHWGPGLFRKKRDGAYEELPADLDYALSAIMSAMYAHDDDPESENSVHNQKLGEEWLELLMRPESLAQLPLCAQNAVFFNLPWYRAWKAARGRGVPPASDPCWRETGRS